MGNDWNDPAGPGGEAAPLRGLEALTLGDLEALRLILGGGSVVDWMQLHLDSPGGPAGLLRTLELEPTQPIDAAYIDHVKREAIAYLKRNFGFAIPGPVARASLEELLWIAAGKGHRQVCACTVLKVVHIIHHLNGRELLFRLPVSDQDMFHLVEEKVYRVVGAMLSEGLPISELIGGRKNLDSTYTKLLSKPGATTTAVYDKLRFRVVTRTREQIMPVLLHLTERLFPFNYVVPGESTNTIFHFRSFCEAHPHLRRLVPGLQPTRDDDVGAGDNQFSAPSYRVIHFIADVPVRVPPQVMELAPPGSDALGPVVFVLVEFQILDAESEASNEAGDANHEAYKARQRQAVYSRLRLGPRGRG
ncbi:MAG: TIGR04552 family protein [Polyangiaceae bacterium]|nr:TIGR04552 family protein [Polyangiaceae bacterium]